MLTKTRITIALVVSLLLAAALANRVEWHPWLTGFVLGFGLFNVLVETPGTSLVRATAVGASIGALLMPALFGVAVALAWTIWIPAYVVAMTSARDGAATPADEPPQRDAAGTRARFAVAALITAVAIGSFAYRVIVAHGLQQTAALFIGIPAILAIVVVVAVSPQSAMGVAFKAVTVGLLVSMLFLQEGILCIAMSAPLFYAVAGAIAGGAEFFRAREQTRSNRLFSSLVVLVLVPMTFEGVTDFTTVNRNESVVASKIVHASSAAVGRALFEAPHFERPLPLYLRAGFPWPEATRVVRAAGTTHLVIQVRGGEMLLNGMEPRTGELVLALEESRPGLVRWRALSDSSHMTHFLTWREIVVQYQPVDAGTTKVTWTLRYSRGLDPAWYFGPMERYAAGLAADYLIDAVATP